MVVGGISRGKLPCGPRLQHGEREAAGGEEVAHSLPPDATWVTIACTLIVPRAHAHWEPTWPANEQEGVEAPHPRRRIRVGRHELRADGDARRTGGVVWAGEGLGWPCRRCQFWARTFLWECRFERLKLA